MLSKIKTWILSNTALVVVAAGLLGVATLVYAQEEKRNTAEIQVQIERLQAELQQASQAERQQAREESATKTTPMEHNARTQSIQGNYLGTEGNDWIGIVIGEPKGNDYPITIYEDGLPDHGYNPKDDDKYVGIAVLEIIDGKPMLNITLNQKFDEQREEPVERILRNLKASVVLFGERNDQAITIPRNREWGAVRAVKQSSLQPSPPNDTPRAAAITGNALAGRYLGNEGDDRMGMILTPVEGPPGIFDVVFYEDGLPGAGYNRRDDDRYEGTATHKGNTLEIRLTTKFDEDRQEPVERELQRLTAVLNFEQNSFRISIPRNAEWDAVLLRKL